MPAPFTPEQEARIREIVREEIASEGARTNDVLQRVVRGGEDLWAGDPDGDYFDEGLIREAFGRARSAPRADRPAGSLLARAARIWLFARGRSA